MDKAKGKQGKGRYETNLILAKRPPRLNFLLFICSKHELIIWSRWNPAEGYSVIR